MRQMLKNQICHSLLMQVRYFSKYTNMNNVCFPQYNDKNINELYEYLKMRFDFVFAIRTYIFFFYLFDTIRKQSQRKTYRIYMVMTHD